MATKQISRLALLTALLFAGLLTAGSARADRRNFAFTYEPKTVPRGHVELEYYMTGAVRRDSLTNEDIYSWAHQVELEYGIARGLDAAMYQMFTTDGWTGYKLRGRYMPFSPSELAIDFLLYGEFIHKANGDVAFEERLVIGRSFGPLIVSLDSMTEQGPVAGDTSFKLHHSLALGYEATKWFTAGLETQVRMSWEPKFNYVSADNELEFAGVSTYMGPSVSLASTQFFWDVGVAFRVQDDETKAKNIFRVLWGVSL